jgi:hypothetical protein
MQIADNFDVLFKGTVSLSQVGLGMLDSRVTGYR